MTTTNEIQAVRSAYRAAIAATNGTTGPYDAKAQKAVHARWTALETSLRAAGLMVKRADGRTCKIRRDDWYKEGVEFLYA